MPDNPGYYVNQYAKRGLKWHLVESKIADRYVTRCGRQMPRRNPRRGEIALAPHVPSDGAICVHCARAKHTTTGV